MGSEELSYITNEQLLGDYKMLMSSPDEMIFGTTFKELANVVKIEIIARELEVPEL